MKDQAQEKSNTEETTPNPVDLSFMIDVPDAPKLSEEEARFYGADAYEEDEDPVYSTAGSSVPETLRRIEGNKILDKHRKEANPDKDEEEKDESKPEDKKEAPAEDQKKPEKVEEKKEEPKEEEEEKPSRRSAKEVFSDDDFKPSFEGFDKKKEAPEEDPFASEKEFISTLSPAEKQSLEIWKYAEKLDPQYKGRAKRQLEYIKAHREESEKFLKEDPETPLKENPDYVDWVNKNRPKVDPDEFSVLGQEYLVYKASREAEKRVEEKYKPLKEKVKEFENRPKLQESVSKYTGHLIDFLPEDLNKAYKEAGNDPEKIKEIHEKFPLETAVAGNEFRKAQALGKSLMELRLGFKSFDEKDPVQKELAESVVRFGQQMLQHPDGDKVLVQDGKKFVPRERFNELPAEEQKKHWTFTDQDVLELLATDMEIRIKKGIEIEKKRQEDLVKNTLKSRGLPAEEIERILKGANANEKPEEKPVKKGPRATSPHRIPPSRTPGSSAPSKSGGGSSLLDSFLDPKLED